MNADVQPVLSRRSFLGGALALAAATAIPAHALRALGPIPAIVGDGVHDDTAGLQAAFDGKPFRLEGKAYVVNRGGEVYLSGGAFRLSDTLHIRNVAKVRGGVFDGSDIPEDRKAVLSFETGLPLHLADITVKPPRGVYAARLDFGAQYLVRGATLTG